MMLRTLPPCALFSFALHDGNIAETADIKFAYYPKKLLANASRSRHVVRLFPNSSSVQVNRALRDQLHQFTPESLVPAPSIAKAFAPELVWQHQWHAYRVSCIVQYRVDPRFVGLTSDLTRFHMPSSSTCYQIATESAHMPPSPPCNIVTEQFFATLAAIDTVNKQTNTTNRLLRDTFQEHYPEAVDMHYLFVGGLFSSQYPGYFAGNMKRLRKLGIQSVTNLPTNGVVGSAKNAAVIAHHIETLAASEPCDKKIVLIGHSKGVADIHVTMALYPHLLRFIFGVIAIQVCLSRSRSLSLSLSLVRVCAPITCRS
jgi:hypothetical protein